MIRLNAILDVKHSSKYLILILVWISSLMAHSSIIQGTNYVPLQESETTWDLLESDFPNAVFTDVSFINSTHGWIAGRAATEPGSNATVLHTKNGGDSWQLQFNNDEQWITSIDVLDEQTMWINGMGSLFYTLDGGTTWNESVVVGGNAGMSPMKFINMTHGWTANQGVLYQTTDSGQSWGEVAGFTHDDTFRMIQCLSTVDIWAIGFSGIYHSTDGGVTWEKVSNWGGSALSFVSESEGWAIGSARLAHTIDGNTWVELVVPMRAPLFRMFEGPFCSDIQFIDENNGWIVGTEIKVMYTPDGGANWYQQSVPA
ncbi:MAG: WD40/YVTN/BNR-like repeat-containing protein, partial [Planctomycetota bacterium]